MFWTEDDKFVRGNEPVYEIIWVYYNAEWSEPISHGTLAALVPLDTKIWLREYNCKAECERLMKVYERNKF